MVNSQKFMKKAFVLLLTMLLLTIAMALPASAATLSYQFLDSNLNYSPHASSFIVGDANVNGNTVTITLSDKDAIQNMLVYDGQQFVQATRTEVGNNVQFTFNVSNFSELQEIQLYVYAPPFHNGYMTLFIEWFD